MAQREIIKWLTKKRVSNNRFYTANDLAEELGCHLQQVYRDLKKLYKYGFLDRKLKYNEAARYRLKKSKVLEEYLE